MAGRPGCGYFPAMRRPMCLLVSSLLCGLVALAAAPARAVPADDTSPAPHPLPRAAAPAAASATAATGDAIVCRTIEAAARASALDAGFFARLLWKESLFQASAVSPAGAQGIAQFMPGTAKLRGLEDAFDADAAVRASAEYLSELAGTYGNIGLAAAAYNGGEARLERFLAAKAELPAETRAYVRAITGYSVETWRDAPPAKVDLSLEGDGFQPGCLALAATRGKATTRARPVLPWGVVIASNRDLSGAERQVSRLKNRFRDVLGAEPVAYTSGRHPGMSRAMHYAQVGRQSRAEAQTLCDRLSRAGADCLVLRN